MVLLRSFMCLFSKALDDALIIVGKSGVEVGVNNRHTK